MPDAWDRVVSAAGLTKSTPRSDLTNISNYGEFPLPFFEAMHRFPLRIPFYARVLRHNALTAAPAASELIMVAGWRMNECTRRTLIGDPLADEAKKAAAPDALLSAIRDLHSGAGKQLTPAQANQLKQAVQVVPADVARNAALVLLTEKRAAMASTCAGPLHRPRFAKNL